MAKRVLVTVDAVQRDIEVRSVAVEAEGHEILGCKGKVCWHGWCGI